MVDIPFLLGGGGASLAGPQREQQHSHVGPLPCGVFAGQAPLILVDSILILSSCCFRISIYAVYLPMYNCGLFSYTYIYIHTSPCRYIFHFQQGVEPFSTVSSLIQTRNLGNIVNCLALPPIGTIGVVIIYYSFVSMAISGTDVLQVPSICLRTIC